MQDVPEVGCMSIAITALFSRKFMQWEATGAMATGIPCIGDVRVVADFPADTLLLEGKWPAGVSLTDYLRQCVAKMKKIGPDNA